MLVRSQGGVRIDRDGRGLAGMKPEEKRKQILQGLEEVCRDRRFHEVTLDEVAQIAGVGKGTIYRYFADKEDLFHQLVAHGIERLCQELQVYVGSSLPFRELLIGMCQTISAFFQARHTLARMAGEQESCASNLNPRRRAEFMEHRKRLDDRVAQILRSGCISGELRTDIPVEVMARFLMAMMRERNTTFAESPLRPEVATVVEAFLNGCAGFDPEIQKKE